MNVIVGAWRLLAFEIKTSTGEVTAPFGDRPQGSIIYTESGRYAAQVMRPGRASFVSGNQLSGTPEEIEAAFIGCISYFGSFDYDAIESVVTHYVEASLFPNWEGNPQRRFVTFSDDRLTLSTPPTLWGGGGEVVGVLTWQRIG